MPGLSFSFFFEVFAEAEEEEDEELLTIYNLARYFLSYTNNVIVTNMNYDELVCWGHRLQHARHGLINNTRQRRFAAPIPCCCGHVLHVA